MPEGTPGALIPLIVVIESVRLIIRPFTLAVRLAANIVAGHLLILVLLGNQGAKVGGAVLVMLVTALILLLKNEQLLAFKVMFFTIFKITIFSERYSLTIFKINKNVNNIYKFNLLYNYFPFSLFLTHLPP